jgi:pyruvate,water dikinase
LKNTHLLHLPLRLAFLNKKKSPFKILFCLLIFCLSALHYSSAQEPCPRIEAAFDEYLTTVNCLEEFMALQQSEKKQNYQLHSMRVTYHLERKQMYFIKTPNYETHFSFCKKNLGYRGSHSDFNNQEYSVKGNRKYVNFTLTYFKSLDIFTLDFAFLKGEISPNILMELFNKLNQDVYFANKIKLLIEPQQSVIKSIPCIKSTDIYDESYECLNPGVAYGYLKIITHPDQLDEVTPENIVLLKINTLNVPICAAIINENYQPPLSHINVLAKNRSTPNMRLPDAASHFRFEGFRNRLVRLEVKQGQFLVKLVDLPEAEKFWGSRIIEKVDLPFDTTNSAILPTSKLAASDVSVVGAKAANFAELQRIALPNGTRMLTPEHAFAIPFFYYQQHLNQGGVQDKIDHFLDSLTAKSSLEWKKRQCEALQQKIMEKPIDPNLVNQVASFMIVQNDRTVPFRFRSSSNAEDLAFFNGAGLYTSKTAILGHKTKTIENAIKKVWASFWSYPAFAERTYLGVNHRTAFMGILVHRSFPNEKANGVALTINLENPNEDGCYVNVQSGESSIVQPDSNLTCDEINIKFRKKGPKWKYANHSSLIDTESTVLTDEELLQLIVMLKAIKNHFFTLTNSDASYTEYALEVEFKLDTSERLIYIKQVRSFPIK